MLSLFYVQFSSESSSAYLSQLSYCKFIIHLGMFNILQMDSLVSPVVRNSFCTRIRVTITRSMNNIYTRQYLNVLRTRCSRMVEGEIGWQADERMGKGETER